MEITEQISIIKTKLNELTKKDPIFKIFGANSHCYKTNPLLSESEIHDFEIKNQIKLPEGYREFLKQVGNGGAGPYYGLQALQDGLFASLDYKNPNELVELSKEFPCTEPWNANVEGMENATEEQYDEIFAKEYANPVLQYGILRLSNYGCGVSLNLIVNGKEYGNIWVDDRTNYNGIYPISYSDNNLRVNFLQWYEKWLDLSLEEFNEKQKEIISS